MTESKGQRGVAFAIKDSVLQDVEKDGLAVEHISARLVKVRLNFNGKSNGISIVVAYASTIVTIRARQRSLFDRTRQHSCRSAETRASARHEGRQRSHCQKGPRTCQ